MPSWAGTFAYSNVPPADLDLPVSEARDDGDSKHEATRSAILVGLWLTLNGSMYRLQRFPRALGIDITPHCFHYFVKVREGPLLEPRWERQVTQLVQRKLHEGLERDHHPQLVAQESLDSLAPLTWGPVTAFMYC